MSTNTENTQLAALFGKTRRRVVGALCESEGEPQFLRQIARTARVSAGTVRRELLTLTTAGILIQEKKGRQVLYRLNPGLSFAPELKSIFHKTTGIADALRRALQPLKNKIELAFIYGSFAAGTARVGSDVDVALVGSVSVEDAVRALGPVQMDLGREMNPAVFGSEEFRKKLVSNNPFLVRVWKGPKIILIGDADDFGAVGK